MIGQTISHYKITEKLGEGGMGEVYLAEDTSLKRKVALKFLPDYLQQDEVAQKRFLREAQSAAALDHPYICHIHEVGEADGKNFIAMEYVKGETLQQRLVQGRIPLAETLRISTEVTEALEEAHQQGIVHRDLKPSNIMLTPKGHAKVMDFGLAKRLPEAGDLKDDITAALTREGTTLGTLAYMSPEQTRGKAADTRADIFSFGIVLYEMLTGVHPFRRETQAETSNAILNEQPPPLDRYTEDTSDLLQHTLEKMLAKDPNQRYQSVHEVGTNLNKLSEKLSGPRTVPGAAKAKHKMWLGAGAALAVLVALVLAVVYFYQPSPEPVGEAPIDSIAILPFENESEDPDTEYLSDGIGENIAFKLAPIRGLRVILSPDQLQRYRGQQVDAQTVAQELNVKTVLTGSLKVIEDTIALRIRLYDAKGSLLWGQPYSRELTDLVTIQEEIAGQLVEKLQLQLRGEEEEKIKRNPTENLQAYEAYRNGMNIYMDHKDYGRAIQYLERAIRLDPGFGLAYWGVSLAYLSLCGTEEDYCAKYRQAVEKFIEMEENSPQAQVAKGVLLAYDRDWEAAGEEFRKAEYPTSNSYAFVAYLVWMGHLDEAAEHVEMFFRTVDPLSAKEQLFGGWNFQLARKYDLALEKYRRVRELDPNRPIAWYVWECYLGKGLEQETFSAFLSMREKQGDNPEKLEQYKQVFTESRMQGVYRLLLDDFVEKNSHRPLIVAEMNALAGEKELAFEWLEKYCESVRFLFWYPFPAYAHFDPLRSDPRFEQLLRKLNLPEEAIQRHLALPGG